MKIFFITVGFFISLNCAAQTEILGKWKPIKFTMGNLISGDVKNHSTILSDSVDVLFKNDKDPKASKEMMLMMADMMLEKISGMRQEFLSNGEYIIINADAKRSEKGTFHFDLAKMMLDLKTAKTAMTYKVSFLKKNLILSSELSGLGANDKDEMIVEYERLN